MTVKVYDTTTQKQPVQIPPMFDTSTSTMGEPLVATDASHDLSHSGMRLWRLPSLNAIVVATMVPFGSIYEPVRKRLHHEAATLGAYVIIVGDEDESMFHSPAVFAVDPLRKTFHFESRLRHLPRREPFISRSDLIGAD